MQCGIVTNPDEYPAIQLSKQMNNLTGKTFNRLTVLRPVGSKHRSVLWLCSCQCGRFLITKSQSLSQGRTQSCGCRAIDVRRAAWTKPVNAHWVELDGSISIRLERKGGSLAGVARISAEDIDILEQRFCLDARGYVSVTNADHHRRSALHRLIMPRVAACPNDTYEVDHINRDKLDNRRENLRWATKSQNKANSRRRRDVAGYRGVYTSKKKWRARLLHGGTIYGLGTVVSRDDAALAYNVMASFVYDGCSLLNVIGEERVQ